MNCGKHDTSFKPVLQTTAWPHWISGQVLSRHSIVSSSRIVRPCSPWGGRWNEQEHSTVWSSAPHSGRRGGHTPFVQAGAETSDTSAEGAKPDRCCTWEGHSGGVGAGDGDENVESCRVVRPLRRTYVVVVRWTDELLCGRCKWMSRFEAPCICTRWTGARWVEQMPRLHGRER